MKKYVYRVYDCNYDDCRFVGAFDSLDVAKNQVFMLGEKFNERRFYVVEVYNNFTNRIGKIHYSSTSRFYNESFSCYFHQICLDYGKMPQHQSFFTFNFRKWYDRHAK